MEIIYEWSVEVEDENGDIVESEFATTLNSLLEYEGNIVLVRRVGSEEDGEVDRLWAYVEDGKLPEYFSDGSNVKIEVRVPKRFHKEYEHRQI